MCPLVKELKGRNGIRTLVCVSGQHREMLTAVLEVFGVVPDYDLAVMKKNQTLGEITSQVLIRLHCVFEKDRPDLILVHGDTTTAFAAALAGFYLKIPVGHVEAGLRTYDLNSPYPEEFNRQAVGLLAEYHFAPTAAAADNLRREGKKPEHIFVTGNTGIDAMKTTVREGYENPELTWARGSRLIILTAHRRENVGEPLFRMLRAVRRVVETARQVLGDHEQIHLMEPLSVLDFHNFLNQSYLILTDSGGIQEEAPGLGKPVLVMRDTTERPEGVSAGTLRLTGTEEEAIYQAFSLLLHDSQEYDRMSRASNPYGDGNAGRRIADIIEGMV